MTCEECGNLLDPFWAEVGETRHRQCKIECDHGEVRGPRYCALCRHADPSILPPQPPVKKRKRQHAMA